MYDVDDEDELEIYRSAICRYLREDMKVDAKDIRILQSRSGWHIIVKRCYPIDENWVRTVADYALEYAKTCTKLTIESSLDIIHIVEDIKVQSNQMCLVYYNEVK